MEKNDKECLLYDKKMDKLFTGVLQLNVVESESDNSDLDEEEDFTTTLDVVVGMLGDVKQKIETSGLKKCPKYDKDKTYAAVQEQLKATKKKLLTSVREKNQILKERNKYKLESQRLKKELQRKTEAINVMLETPRKKVKSR